MPELVVIDQQAIENLRALNPGDDDEFLREITAIFIEDTPVRIVELDESLLHADISKFTRAAHSIKGSSANLGAMSLRAVAEKIEHESRTQGFNGMPALIAQLKTEFERAKSELTALVAR